jgi:hypothetical protein
MKFYRKAFPGTVVLLLAAFGAGCSGINTSHSISPATFLLPGLIQAEPRKSVPIADAPVPGAPLQVASAD